jgi:hypothetical protein
VGVLKPTPGPWTVEAFTDRVRLRRSAPTERRAATASAHSGHVGIALPELEPADSFTRRLEFVAADLGPVIAALDLALADDLYYDYINNVDADLGRWRKPHVDQNWVTIDGPVLVAATTIHDSSVELSYDHVAELRLVLVDFANDCA